MPKPEHKPKHKPKPKPKPKPELKHKHKSTSWLHLQAIPGQSSVLNTNLRNISAAISKVLQYENVVFVRLNFAPKICIIFRVGVLGVISHHLPSAQLHFNKVWSI